jgi:hypothetical protein
MAIVDQEDFIKNFSFILLRSELNKLCPGKTWSNRNNDESLLDFEHPTKGKTYLRIHIFPFVDELRNPIVNMFIMSMDNNPNLDTINKGFSLDPILDGIPIESPYYLDVYPVIGKYLIANVFDNWLNDKPEDN